MADDAYAEFHYRSRDGLSLYGRVYGEPAAPKLPLVCLSGLTRNSRDFHHFALAARRLDPERAVVAFDYRGRGRSDHASEPSLYNVPLETDDVILGLEHLRVRRAIFVGTSRGAIIVHVLAAARGDLIAGAVLNDAGPRIEAEGVALIKSYVGKAGTFPDWTAATDYVERLSKAAFPALGREDFARMAEAFFVERDGRIVSDYDERIAETLDTLDPAKGSPELWRQFDALRDIPLLVLRGETSTLFSRQTAERMAERHPCMETIEVAGQGHPPLLETAGLPEAIDTFARRIDP